MSLLSTITDAELAELARADEIDAERRQLYGRFVYCHGAADLRDQANGIRIEVRHAVYDRAGQATGLARYDDAYIRAGWAAVRAAGLD